MLSESSAVTSRLEDVANSQSSPVPASSLSPPTSAAHDPIAGHIGGPSARSQSQAQNGFSEEMSAAVQAYLDEITSGALTELIDKSREIGGPVEQLVS